MFKSLWYKIIVLIFESLLYCVILRSIFFFANFNSYKNSPELFKAFFIGTRYDFATTYLIMTPIILLFILPWGWLPIHQTKKLFFEKFLSQLALIYFTFLTMLSIGLNIADSEYYKFVGRRSTVNLLDISFDLKNQLLGMAFEYWGLSLLSIFLMLLVPIIAIYFFKLIDKKEGSKKTFSPFISLLLLLVIVTSAVISIRGGITNTRPINAGHAFLGVSKESGVLIQNSLYTFLTSIDAPLLGNNVGKFKNYNFFPSQEVVINKLSKLNPRPKPLVSAKDHKYDNVFIIILESFGLEHMGEINHRPGFTPFLDSLTKQGLFFYNGFANGRRSMEAMYSVLMSMPSLFNEPIMHSEFRSFDGCSIAKILENDRGYSAKFFHGGKNGSMFIDVTTALAGFTDYYGLNEYPNKEDFDKGGWGIFDEPFLKYAAELTNKQKSPFINGIFTLSSHSPYHIPKEYEGKLRTGALEIQRVIHYTDTALKYFFEYASKQSWYENTLFVLTADHTASSTTALSSNDQKYSDVAGHYRVPILFFHGKKGVIKPEVRSDLASHIDILPSIFHFLDLEPKERMLFGRSLFDKEAVGRTINFTGGEFVLFHDKRYLTFRPNEQQAHLFSYTFLDPSKTKNITQEEPNEAARMTEEIKLFIQYFANGLSENKLMTTK